MTVELEGSNVFVVHTPPAAALLSADDDGDGQLDLREVSTHRAPLRAQLDQGFYLSAQDGTVARCDRTDISTPGSGMAEPGALPKSDHLRVTRRCSFPLPPTALVLRDASAGIAPLVVEALRAESPKPGVRRASGPPEHHVLASRDATVTLLRLSATPTAPTRLALPSPSPATGAARGSQDTWAGWFTLGLKHVALGLDHLLFIAALLLGLRRWPHVFGAVSAFTLTHTLALAGILLGLLPQLPGSLIEPCIALSIASAAYAGLQSLRPRTAFVSGVAAGPASEEQTLPLEPTLTRPAIVAAGFGLLHGLGLARSALEIFPRDQSLPLLPFALGTETSQLGLAALFLAIGAFLPTAAKRLLGRLLVLTGIAWACARLLGVG